MSWQTLSIEVSRERSADAEDAFLASGAMSVTLCDAGDDPVLETPPGETPLWPRVRLSGLYPADADPERARLELAAALGDQGLRVDFATLPDREWVRAWMDRFGPMRFGARLWIVPRGSRAPDARAVTLHLDPGLAFGTGTHPTTALCLEWLDAHAPRGLEVLDYGCGSGVLGIAAALLGASRVWCVDHDVQALRATRENARVNGVEDRIRVCAPAELPPSGHELILANILFQPLLELAPRFASLATRGGALVMSGVLEPQAASLVAAYAGAFEGFETATREGWARVAADRLD